MKSFKILIVLTFIITILFLTLVSAYVRAIQIQNIIQSLTQLNYKTSDAIYNDILWQGYGDYINNIYTRSSNNNNDTYFLQFKNYFIKFSADLPFEKVALYLDNKSKIVESDSKPIVFNEPELFDSFVLYFLDGYNSDSNKLFDEAKLKGTSSRIVTNARFNNKKTVFIETIDLLSTSKNNIAYLQFYTDITHLWNFYYNLQVIVSGTFVLFVLLLIIIIMVSSIKTQKILDKQIEANIKLEEAKKKAEEVSQQKSMFLANMSHELRTPLNSIIGFSEIIKNQSLGNIGEEKYVEYGADINSAGTHLLSLINDILDFSKAEADKLVIEKIEVDVIKMIKQCLRIIKPKADEAKLSLVDKTDEKHYILDADPKRLKQVFLNILSNAIKFTPENGSVTVLTEVDLENKIMNIKIVDSGIGIAPKDISKVMQPFVQVENSLSKKHAGTGLGLPLTKKLIELMEGKFHIESEPSFGTTVIMTFNLSENNFNTTA